MPVSGGNTDLGRASLAKTIAEGDTPPWRWLFLAGAIVLGVTVIVLALVSGSPA